MKDNIKKKKKSSGKDVILNVLLVMFLCIFIFSAVYLFNYYYKSYKNEKKVDHLHDLITKNETKEGEKKASESDADLYIVTSDGKRILKKYKDIYELNHDFIGWLKIDGTAIDYPVVYTPEDEQEYLRLDFEKNYLIAGTLFLSAKSVPEKPGNNMIIYGHNMKNGTMFSDVLSYKDESFYKTHKYIDFGTIYFENKYEVVAAFKINVNNDGFDYYNHSGVLSEEEFNNYIENCSKLSEYQFDSKAKYNDELITLSTCDSYGSHEGNRFVVVAKKIK